MRIAAVALAASSRLYGDPMAFGKKASGVAAIEYQRERPH
jgi:hypothetical protein